MIVIEDISIFSEKIFIRNPLIPVGTGKEHLPLDAQFVRTDDGKISAWFGTWCTSIDDGDIETRYLRITVTGTEKTGMYAAIWNIKIYDHLFEIPPYQNKEVYEGPGVTGRRRLLIDVDLKDEPIGKINRGIGNKGELGGEFTPAGEPVISFTDGVKSITLRGEDFLTLSN